MTALVTALAVALSQARAGGTIVMEKFVTMGTIVHLDYVPQWRHPMAVADPRVNM